MGSVLVLNASHEPLNVVSVRRAIVLLLKDKAEVLEATEQRVRSAGLSIPVPLVIRLVYYVRVPYRLNVPLSRRTVLMRDNYTCQYCGAQPSQSELTVDHIVPKVRGGETSWENVVCACRDCNLSKGSRLLSETNMRLLNEPGRPRYIALVFACRANRHQAWNKYISDMEVATSPAH